MTSDVASDLEKQKKYKTIYNFLGQRWRQYGLLKNYYSIIVPW